MSDLTQLGLKGVMPLTPPPPPSSSSASERMPVPVPVAPIAPVTMAVASPLQCSPATVVESRAGDREKAFATFLDRLLDLLSQLAPESDTTGLAEFRRQLAEYRTIVADPTRSEETSATADACIETCRKYLENSHVYRTEREKELSEVISILRDAAKLSVGDSASFHAQVLASSERFTTIAGLQDIRDLRKRLGDEVGTLRRAVAEKQQRDEHAYSQLTSRVETLQKKLSDMEVEATLDPLTCVGNRRRFQLSLAKMVAQAQQSGAPLSLAMVDIDDFKKINDAHGHLVGDRVLLSVAQKLGKAVRQTDVVARYGGEEFAMLLEHVSAMDVESRLRQLLGEIAASPYEYGADGRKEQVCFTVSCGLTDFIAGESEEALVKRADEALYEAKQKGRNRLITRRRSLIGRVLSWG